MFSLSSLLNSRENNFFSLQQKQGATCSPCSLDALREFLLFSFSPYHRAQCACFAGGGVMSVSCASEHIPVFPPQITFPLYHVFSQQSDTVTIKKTHLGFLPTDLMIQHTDHAEIVLMESIRNASLFNSCLQ